MHTHTYSNHIHVPLLPSPVFPWRLLAGALRPAGHHHGGQAGNEHVHGDGDPHAVEVVQHAHRPREPEGSPQPLATLGKGLPASQFRSQGTLPRVLGNG